jgi:hypothetical protein
MEPTAAPQNPESGDARPGHARETVPRAAGKILTERPARFHKKPGIRARASQVATKFPHCGNCLTCSGATLKSAKCADIAPRERLPLSAQLALENWRAQKLNRPDFGRSRDARAAAGCSNLEQANIAPSAPAATSASI